MPLPMVHLGVARALTELLPVRELPAYYMGVLAPDAYHMREHKTGRERKLSHLCRVDIPPRDVWMADILSYFQGLRERSPFLLGYQVHLLTDCLWFATLYKTFEEQYARAGLPPQDRQKAYYQDTGWLDIELYDSLPCREELWRHLREAQGEDFSTLIRASETVAERDRTLVWYEPARERYREPARHISLGQELLFIRRAADEVAELLKTQSF